MRVKVCGITNIDDALYCTKCGADALGFIFYEKSKRHVSVERTREIIKLLPPFTLKVGVFVNEEPYIVNRIAKEVKLNIVQLHGDETPEYISEIDYPVIKAVRIGTPGDMEKLNDYSGCSFLLDTYDKNEYGGTGKAFDWSIIPEEIRGSVIVAGGISGENIEQVYKGVKPYAVDLSSSLERAAGKKDHKKVKAFFDKLNRLRNE